MSAQSRPCAPGREVYGSDDALGRPEHAYEVRVEGLVSPPVLRELGDVEIATQELRTVLCGRFSDQAALYGFLHRLRAFGIEIVEVRRVVSGDDDSGARSETHGS